MNVHFYCPLSSSKSADVHSKFQRHLQRYFQKHPGGQDILLGVVGRDATVEFETMRHSAIALQQLERYLGPRNLDMEGKNLENAKVRKTDGFFFSVDTGDVGINFLFAETSFYQADHGSHGATLVSQNWKNQWSRVLFRFDFTAWHFSDLQSDTFIFLSAFFFV